MQRGKARQAVGIVAGLALLAATAATQTKPAKPAPKTETGYVVSVGETAMVISNIEPGSGRGPGGGQGGQVFTRRAGPGEGGGPGGGGGVQIQIGPGDVVRGADGKLSLSAEAKKRFTPQQVKMIEEDLNSAAQSGQGGPVIVRRGPGEGPGNAPVRTERAANPGVPLQLTDFVLDKKTKSAGGLNRGDKVKVTFVEADGKKVATRVERAP